MLERAKRLLRSPDPAVAQARVEALEGQVAELQTDLDTKIMKALRQGYSAGPLLEMGYPGADLKLVTASHKRQHEHESEPYISDWIERCFEEEDVFYDIGANVGTYSLIAAGVGLPRGHVYAFEPSFSTYAVLCDNVFVNGLGDRVTTLPVALGARTALETFRYSNLRPGAAKHNWPTGKTAYTHRVLGYRLDDLVGHLELPLPNVVKIDIDGGEPDLLRGAAKTFSSPALRSLIVELLTWTQGDVVAELARHGFELLHVYERPPSPVTCGLFARPGSPILDVLGLQGDG